MATRGELRLGRFLIGMGVGLFVGLLCASRAGEETRKQVRRRAKEGLDYLSQQARKVRERTDKLLAITKDWIGRQDSTVQPETELQKAYQDPKL